MLSKRTRYDMAHGAGCNSKTGAITSTSSTATHPADQAGGEEVIFSSDGLDALPTVQPPPSVQQDEFDSTDDADAKAAFGVFGVTPIETAVEKLERLKREIKDLQKNEQETNAQSIGPDEIRALQAQLETVIVQHWKKPSPVRQQKSKAADDSSVTEAASVSSAVLQDRLTRLEHAIGSSTSTATTTATSASSHNQTLQDRLQALETLHSQLDTSSTTTASTTTSASGTNKKSNTNLDLWQRKAKTIRQDLEAAAKARNKLAGNSSGSGSGTAADTKTLQELYNLSQQLQGMAQQLPALTARLQALSAVHTSRSTWTARLQALEQAVPVLQGQVTDVQASAKELQSSLAENVKQMQTNMQVLEEKYNKSS